MSKYLLLLCLSIPFFSLGQTGISGKVMDTLENKPLRNALVALVGTDSVLYKHTRTAADGSFRMLHQQPGNYKLLVTFPIFADFAEIISLKNDTTTDAGSIALTLMS